MYVNINIGGGGGNRVHTKGICLKGNQVAWLEFKLTYFEYKVHHFSSYA